MEKSDRCLSRNDAYNVCNPQLRSGGTKPRESMDELVENSTKFREAQAAQRICSGERVAITIHHQVQWKVLFKFFYARWKSTYSPLHSVVYILDPEYWNLDLMSNVEVIQDFYQVINTFFSNAKYWISCIKKLVAFRLKEGPFANEFVQMMAKEQPAWKWMMNGGEHYSLLRLLAIKVLAQCAANSSSKRNWSMYKYIHSTICNKLLVNG